MRVTSALCLLLIAGSAQASDLAEAIRAFHEGRLQQAQKLLNSVLSQDESNAEARLFSGLTGAATGRCAEVQPSLVEQFASLQRKDLQRLAGLALAQCSIAQQREEEALRVLSQLRAADPADADVLFLLGKTHLRAWNDVVEQMFAKTPSSYRVNQLSGEIFEMQGKFAEAAAEYRKTIAKNPGAIHVNYRLGRALLLQSHEPAALARAREAFEAELKINAEDSAAEFQIGQILQAEGKPEAALARWERALQLRPDFVEALVAVGKARLQQERSGEAVGLLEKAVSLQPANESAGYSLMMAYRNSGQEEKAARAKAELDKLQRAPEGEFTDFLRRIGEKPPAPSP